MKNIDWVKPSGVKITTIANKETIAYCVTLGWVEDKPTKKPKPKAKAQSPSRMTKQK